MNDPARKVRVLFIGQTPPPYGGQATVNADILGADYERIELRHVRMAYSRSLAEVSRFNLRKVFHFFTLLARTLLETGRYKPDVICYPPSNGDRTFPFIRDLLFLSVLRTCFKKPRLSLLFHSAGLSEALERRTRWKTGWRNRLVRRALFHPAAAIVTSRFNPPDGEALEARRIQEICPGIRDEGGPAPEKESDALQLFFMGVLREDKGIGVLMDACAKLNETCTNWKLTCAGEFVSPTYRAEIEAKVKTSGIAEKVEFAGVIRGEAKQHAFQNTDIFCFPTFAPFESFGVVVAEAMMYQKPVVATAWRGVQSLVQNEETGFLVPVRDSASLATALERLAEDRDKRMAMGKKGRARFVENFTLDRMTNGYETLFYEVGTDDE